MFLVNGLQKFLKDETGAELAEYAVGVALLVAIALVVYKVLGDKINDGQQGNAARVQQASEFTY